MRKFLLAVVFTTAVFANDAYEYFGKYTYCVAGYVFVKQEGLFTQVFMNTKYIYSTPMTCDYYRKTYLKD